jgi:hypothetical protein
MVPLSKVLKSVDTSLVTISDKIDPAFTAAAAGQTSTEGWEALLLPLKNALVFNIPISANSTYHQYVQNTVTKAWTRFTGWNASAILEFNGELYIADATKISTAWSGPADYSANIVAYAQQAFNRFGAQGGKQWTLVRPRMATNQNVAYEAALVTDYRIPLSLGSYGSAQTSGSLWDSAVWDSAIWGSGLDISGDWRTIASYVGYVSSLAFRVSTKTATVQWLSTDYLWRKAGPLV